MSELTRYGTVHNDEIPRKDGQFYLRGQVDPLLATLTAERDTLKAERVRYMDLLRQVRFELHEQKLIDDKEYYALMQWGEGGVNAVSRLETYIELKAKLERLSAAASSLEEALLDMIGFYGMPKHRNQELTTYVREALEQYALLSARAAAQEPNQGAGEEAGIKT